MNDNKKYMNNNNNNTNDNHNHNNNFLGCDSIEINLVFYYLGLIFSISNLLDSSAQPTGRPVKK